jgi:hypothetical protein
MNDAQPRQQARKRWIVVIVVLVGVAGYLVVDEIDRHRHVAWGELRPSNLERFEAQLRTALPLGTLKQDVETYLAREKIPFTYDGGLGPTFRIFSPRANRKLLVFEGDLYIHIDLDDALKVKEISFHYQYK